MADVVTNDATNPLVTWEDTEQVIRDAKKEEVASCCCSRSPLFRARCWIGMIGLVTDIRSGLDTATAHHSEKQRGDGVEQNHRIPALQQKAQL